jgi:uncharacterized RDD family membrane protein YckC
MYNPDNYEYAGFWIRVGAALIDSLLILAVTAPFLVMIYGPEYYTDSDEIIAGIWDVLISWVFPAVVVLVFWKVRQATPGKMAIKAVIVDAKTGRAPTTGQLIGRYLAYFVAMLPLMLGILWVAWDPRKQGWHDKLAGTVVVKKKSLAPDPVAFGSA